MPGEHLAEKIPAASQETKPINPERPSSPEKRPESPTKLAEKPA